MSETKDDTLDDWNKFFEELQNESPRAAVIIAGAFLDAQLRDLLSNFLVDDSKVVDEFLGSDKNPDRPLSSFSSRIKAAYCLGLISKDIYQDLNTVRTIRNRFAHKMHGYTFDDPEIVKLCNSLKLAKMITDVSSYISRTHGSMFVLGVTQLANWLGIKIIETKKIRRIVPKNITMGQVVIVDSQNKNS